MPPGRPRSTAVSDGSRGSTTAAEGVAAPTQFSVRRYGVVAGMLVVAVVGVLVWVAPWAPAGPATAEEVVALRCLSTDEALAGLESLLRTEPASEVKAREGARVVSIRTTPALLERARAWLAEHDTGCEAP